LRRFSTQAYDTNVITNNTVFELFTAGCYAFVVGCTLFFNFLFSLKPLCRSHPKLVTV